jgi:hypothetical protein
MCPSSMHVGQKHYRSPAPEFVHHVRRIGIGRRVMGNDAVEVGVDCLEKVMPVEFRDCRANKATRREARDVRHSTCWKGQRRAKS